MAASPTLRSRPRRTALIALLSLALLALVEVPSPTAASAADGIQPPEVFSAYNGGGQQVGVRIVGTPGSAVEVHAAASFDVDGTCTKAMSGPGVTVLTTRGLVLDEDGQRDIAFNGSTLVAGQSVYATATSEGVTTPVGNCFEVRAGPPGDVHVTAATATSATVEWSQVAGATGYAVHLTRRNGQVLQTIETGPVGSAEVTGLATSHLYLVNVSSIPRPGEPAPAIGNQTTHMINPPFTTSSAATRQQYLDFRGRTPTNAEDYAWFSETYTGKFTVREKIDWLIDGSQWGGIQSPIIRTYRAAFGRWPDTGGLAYWAQRRRGGTTNRMIATVFTQSSEFQNKYGSIGNRDFVKRMYLNVLGRSADSGGLAYWTKRLDTGAITRAELLIQFSEGSEHVRKTNAAVGTINVTTGMLRRVPTAAELATWAGATPPLRTDLILHILGTDEYGDRITR